MKNNGERSRFELAIEPSGADSNIEHYLDSIKSKISAIKKEKLKENCLEFISIIQQIAEYLLENNFVSRLPSFHISEIDGESILIEWNYKYSRFGFTIENEFKDSSFYFVCNDITDDTFFSIGKTFGRDIKRFALDILNIFRSDLLSPIAFSS
jgi:hypothetical protein